MQLLTDALPPLLLKHRQAQSIRNGTPCHKIKYFAQTIGHSKSKRISKLYHWLKSHGNFVGWKGLGTTGLPRLVLL